MLINDTFMAVNNAVARENLFLYNIVMFGYFRLICVLTCS